MKTKITAGLAFLLVAGASTAALAQEHDHDRGQGAAPHADGPHGPGAGGQPHGPGPGPGPGGSPNVRGEAAPPPAAAPHQGGRGEGGDRGQRFQGQAPPSGGPGGQRFERERGPGPGPGPGPTVSRQFERDRSREVVQPGPSERGWDGRRDGHQVGPAFDARNGRDGRWDDRNGDRRGDGRGGDRHWGRGDHWQSGRYPPVFWAQDRFRVGPYRQPYGYYVRSWAFGDFLPRGWFAEPYWIGDFLDYDLPYPPPGFEWVRVGGDALLVDRYNGRIVQIVRGIFW